MRLGRCWGAQQGSQWAQAGLRPAPGEAKGGVLVWAREGRYELGQAGLCPVWSGGTSLGQQGSCPDVGLFLLRYRNACSSSR